MSMNPDTTPLNNNWKSLDHGKAAVKVSVTGLALSCFNPQTHEWEVNLIHDPQHTLTIFVKRFLPNVGKYSESTLELGPGNKISISASRAIRHTQSLFKVGDGFDRKNPAANHEEDLRWIVDFEREFNKNERVKLSRPSNVTELYVSDPVLYADAARKSGNMMLVNLENRKAKEEPFGALGEACNADIQCVAGGSVTLRVDGPEEFLLVLPFIPGKPHEITFRNECLPSSLPIESLEVGDREPGEAEPTPVTDFSLYFPLLNLPKRDVKKKEDPNEAGRAGADAVCNPSFLSVTTSLGSG